MKKKIITLSTFIAIFTITMFVLIYLCFFADKQFLDLGYSNQDIKLFHKYQIENKITNEKRAKYNQTFTFKLFFFIFITYRSNCSN